MSTVDSFATYVFYLSFSEGYSDKECHKGGHPAYTNKNGCKSHIGSITSIMLIKRTCTLEILKSCRKANRGTRASKETPFIREDPSSYWSFKPHDLSPKAYKKIRMRSQVTFVERSRDARSVFLGRTRRDLYKPINWGLNLSDTLLSLYICASQHYSVVRKASGFVY